MLKVKPVDGYPPEPGRYIRGNDHSPVAVCVILDTFDWAIPKLTQPQHSIEPGKSRMGMGLVLHKTDCQKCRRKTCLAFAIDLAKGRAQLEECPLLDEVEFAENRRALAKLLE